MVEDTMKAVQPQPVLHITDGTAEQPILEKGKEINIAKEKEKENFAAHTLITLPSVTLVSSHLVKLGLSTLASPMKLLMSSTSPSKEIDIGGEDIDLDEVI